MTFIHEYARDLLRRGLIPIPLCQDSKQISYRAMGLQPYHTLAARKRFKDVAFQSLAFYLALQPPSPEDVDRWMSDHDGNLGIVAGFGGLVVLDFDDKSAFEAWAGTNPGVLGTPIEQTRAGFHVYLRCGEPMECSTFYVNGRKAGHIKGMGGYVACAPSRLGGVQSYSWLDAKSPFDVAPVEIPDLAAISVQPRSPLRRAYERLLSRGTYVPHEQLALAETGDA